MKKKLTFLKFLTRTFLTFMFAVMCSNFVGAQMQVAIGSGGTGTSSYWPNYYLFNYSYSQQIVYPSEMNVGGAIGKGLITKIYYLPKASVSTTYWKDWVIYMGNTTKNTFESTTDWISVSSMTEVFNGTLPDNVTANQWLEITLSTPFQWDGLSNIVIAVDENTADYANNPSWAGYTTDANKAISFYDDDTNPSPANPPTADARNTSSSSVAQIKFEFTPTATCVYPTGLNASDIAARSATINWTASSSDPSEGYQLFYNTTGVAPDESSEAMASVVAGTTSISTGDILAPETEYFVWLRANCGEGDLSYWVGPISFTTTQIPAILPYEDDFETNNFSFVNGTQTNKWAYGSATGNPDNAIYISSDDGVSNAYTISSASVVQAYRDIAIPSDASFANFSFDWKAQGESSFDYFRVWLVPTSFMPVAGTQISAGTGRIQLGTNYNQQGTWQTYQNPNLDLSSFAGQSMRLVFEWRNNASGGAQPPAAIDNISLFVPDCVSPSNFAISGASTETASVTWTASTSDPEYGYDLYIALSNTAPTEATEPTSNTDENSFLFEDLDENTDYYIWIRSNCSDTDQSDWLGPIEVYTGYCTPAFSNTTDFITNFSLGGINNSTAFSPSGYGNYTNLFAHLYSGSHEASLTSSSGIGNHGAAIWIDFNDNLIFEESERVGTYGNNIGPNVTVSIPVSIPVEANIGSHRLRVIYQYATEGLDIDPCASAYHGEAEDYTVIITEPPTCMAPTGLSVSNIAATSATISWEESVSEPGDGYQLFYNTTGVAPDESSEAMASVVAGTTSISTGDILAPETEYFVWLRANCGEGDYSVWIGPYSFATPLVTPIPWYEGFATTTLPNGWTNSGMTFGSSVTAINDGGASGNYIYKNLYGTGSNATGSFSTINIGSITGAEDFSFDYKIAAYSSPYTPPASGSGNFILEISTDFGDTWETIDTVENDAVAGWQNKSYPMTAYADEYVKFRITSNRTDGNYYIAFDNFNLANCLPVSNLSASGITESSATISWTASATSPENYQVYVSNENTAPTEGATYQTVPEATIDLSGLTHSTMYYVWVRTNCGESETSIWAGPLHVYTGYCIPTNTSTSYWISSLTTTGGITNITHTGITSQPSGYGDFSATHSCSNVVGQPTTINFAQNTSTGYYFCWIDWNKNMQFDATELVIASTSSYESTYQGTINIPAGTEPGEYRMRVANSWSGAVPNACTGSNNGQFHDYTFIVIDPPTCYPPIGLTVGTQTVSTATITWDDYNDAPDGGYEVYYSTTNTTPDDSETDVIEIEAGVQTATIDELEIETDYYVWVRAICGDDDNSVWAGPVHINIGYCTPAFSSTSDYITNFSLGEINNSTGFSPGGYGNYTDLVANLTSGNNEASLTSSSGSGNHGAAIWIDFNDNLIFEESERVGTYGNNIGPNVTVSIPVSIPADANPGSHRLRVIYQYNTAGLNINPCASASFGEAEDYTVNIGEPLNNETDIIAYSFAEQIAPANIDDVEHKVYITVESGTNLNGLVATFTLSPGASATVAGLPQQSGVTPNNFTYPVVYKVVAENGLDEQPWQVLVDVNVGIEDVENSALAIYPNPNNGNFTLDFANINGKVNYQIFDTKGSIILNENFVANGNAIKEVSLNLVPGVYFVKLITENQSLIEKLVVE